MRAWPSWNIPYFDHLTLFLSIVFTHRLLAGPSHRCTSRALSILLSTLHCASACCMPSPARERPTDLHAAQRQPKQIRRKRKERPCPLRNRSACFTRAIARFDPAIAASPAQPTAALLSVSCLCVFSLTPRFPQSLSAGPPMQLLASSKDCTCRRIGTH